MTDESTLRADRARLYVIERRELHPNGKGGEVRYYNRNHKMIGQTPINDRWIEFGEPCAIVGRRAYGKAWDVIQNDPSEPTLACEYRQRPWVEVAIEKGHMIPAESRERLAELSEVFRAALNAQPDHVSGQEKVDALVAVGVFWRGIQEQETRKLLEQRTVYKLDGTNEALTEDTYDLTGDGGWVTMEPSPSLQQDTGRGMTL